MTEQQMPDWKLKALSDPNLKYKRAKILMNGPKSLSDAWFLQAMKFKYALRN